MRSNRFSFGRGGGRQMPAAPPPTPEPDRYDDQPGHTRAFTVQVPDGGPGQPSYYGAGDASGAGAGAGAGNGMADTNGSGGGTTHVTTYRAGTAHPQVSAARLAWRPLLAGIFRHPHRTFAQMRGHQVWTVALIVSAVYGALAVFGFGDTRDSVLNSTFSLALTYVLSSAVGMIIAGLMFGGVTHVLGRRLGGDGAWAPTIGFAMIISFATDAPRLLFSLFLPSDNGFVQLLGWLTWLYCVWLLTAMVRQLHDLPWAKAAGAASIQLILLLVVIKLPTLS
ncbi:Yip1 family protein [Streptacidiphilus sp. N1-10]|uniref:Yip1 family protein n=1 Tax=Streptacidiphilus jeojiensis TaxID=3229225 RepID=A0ABV6XLU7_9ACTN